MTDRNRNVNKMLWVLALVVGSAIGWRVRAVLEEVELPTLIVTPAEPFMCRDSIAVLALEVEALRASLERLDSGQKR